MLGLSSLDTQAMLRTPAAQFLSVSHSLTYLVPYPSAVYISACECRSLASSLAVYTMDSSRFQLSGYIRAIPQAVHVRRPERSLLVCEAAPAQALTMQENKRLPRGPCNEASYVPVANVHVIAHLS